ncbi:MAG TPA: hypothetical protein VMH84_02010 [Xanthobacteraceae bacterium]|nr:hypothetical protein [Xanthobacteraceae bacterium]
MAYDLKTLPKFEFEQVTWSGILKGLVVVALASAVWVYFRIINDNSTLTYVLVFAFGGLLGLTEILGRYSDSPRAAFNSPGAFFYVSVNAFASALALFLLIRLAPTVTNSIAQVLLAGLGAMAFLRSSVFRARVGDEEVAIGPAVILDTLLKFADAQVERGRAIDRATRIANVIQSLPLAQAGADLPRLCFALMQNLPAEVRQRVLDDITLIVTDTKRSDAVKAMEIGLVLWSRVGIGTLTGAVELLKKNAPIPIAVVTSGPPVISLVPPPPQGRPQDLVADIQRQLAQDRKLAKVS